MHPKRVVSHAAFFWKTAKQTVLALSWDAVTLLMLDIPAVEANTYCSIYCKLTGK